MKISLIFLFLFSAITLSAQDAPAGTWNIGTDNTTVEIAEENGVYTGSIVSSDNTKAKIGATILKDIKLSGGAWKGKMYNPKKEKWYNATLENNGAQLLVKVKAGIVSKTLKWKKA